jgi:hypothetical protein
MVKSSSGSNRRSLDKGEKSTSREMNYMMLIILGFVLGALLSYLYFSGSGSVRCDQFHEPAFQGTCYTNLAADRLDPSICASLVGLGSVNGCYKEVAIAARDQAICARIDDNLLKDSCYNRVGALTKDKSICDKIQDLNSRNGCYSEIGVGDQTEPSGDQSNNTAPNNPTGTTPTVTDYKGQNVTMVSAYFSKKYVLFQIRAPFSNTAAINIKDMTFFVSDNSYPINQWTGELNGPACTAQSTLNPGQNCFARIDNVSCKLNDLIKVALPGGFVDSMEISSCTP